MEFNIFTSLKEAYETSTMNQNRFISAINRVNWEDKFQAEGEYYFCIGKMTFTTPSLEPFNGMDYKPSAIFTDGSYIEF